MNPKHFEFMMNHAKAVGDSCLANEIATKFLAELKTPKQTSEAEIEARCMELLGISKLK